MENGCILRRCTRFPIFKRDYFIGALNRWGDAFREVAGSVMLMAFFCFKRRFHLSTNLLCHGTTGMKAASARDINRTR